MNSSPDPSASGLRSPWALLAAGIALLFSGQLALQSAGGARPIEIAIPTLSGLALIVVGVQRPLLARLPAGAAQALRRRIDPSQSPYPGYLAALLASASAGAIAGDDRLARLPALTIPLWLASIGLALVASGARLPRVERLPRPEFLGLTVLLALALTVRILRLGTIPWLLAGDEGSVGLSALEFLRGDWTNPFRVGWYSFPSLFFVLPAISIRALGPTIEALRLPAALAGALTVAALFLYARAVFGKTTAFLAAAYLAFFHFHVHFSRIGLNNIWDPLFLTLFAWLVWYGWSQEDRAAFAWAGLVAGLGFYFYTSSRILIVLVPAWMAVAALRDGLRLRRTLPGWGRMLLVAVVVVLPLAIFYLRHPDEFMAPMQRVSLLGKWLTDEIGRTALPAWRILGERMVTSAAAFTFAKLGHWYRIDHPMLLPLPATLFLIGTLLAAWRALDLRYTWILLWLAAGIAVGGLSESTPAAQRYVFVAPAVAVLVVVPLTELTRLPGPRRRLLTAGAIGILLAAVLIDTRFYFADYTPSRRFSDTNTEIAQTLAVYLADSGLAAEHVEVYFSGKPRMGVRSIPTLAYLAQGAVLNDLDSPLEAPPALTVGRPAVFVFLPNTLDDLAQVRAGFPGGETTVQLSADGKELYTLYRLP